MPRLSRTPDPPAPDLKGITDMTLSEALRSCTRQFATFTGRARRSEFWWWTLAVTLTCLAASAVDSALFPYAWLGGPLGTSDTDPTATLVGLAALLPTTAVTARRLHDIGRSGWWQLVLLIPLVGLVMTVVWGARPSDPGTNRFGPSPAPAPLGAAPMAPIQDVLPPRPY